MAKKTTRVLPCELTEDEILEAGNDLAINVAQYNALEDEKKAALQEYTEKLKSLDGIQRKLAKMIETKKEDREVECLYHYHRPERGQKTLVRLDTAEVVEVTPMNIVDDNNYKNESQHRIPFN
jgi:hypothetical protein